MRRHACAHTVLEKLSNAVLVVLSTTVLAFLLAPVYQPSAGRAFKVKVNMHKRAVCALRFHLAGGRVYLVVSSVYAALRCPRRVECMCVPAVATHGVLRPMPVPVRRFVRLIFFKAEL